MIEHLRQAHVAENFVLCTTDKAEDQALVEAAKKMGVQWFQGSTEDILVRLNGAAQKFETDFIVNVEGDDVFCDPIYADRTLDHHLKTNADFIRWTGLPLGATPLGISVKALSQVCALKETTNTDTGWGHFFTDSGMFKVETIEETDPFFHHPEIRMTMDYPEDYTFFKEVFDRLNRTDFTLRDVLQILKDNPSITQINSHLHDEYYKRFEEKRAEVRFRKSKKAE
jgi:spore coat polysaccharide biosynthesis protein SpsF